jgi:TolB protein
MPDVRELIDEVVRDVHPGDRDLDRTMRHVRRRQRLRRFGTGATALLLAALAGAIVWRAFLAAPDTAPATRDPGRIVFVTQDHDDPAPSIAVMEADGSGVRELVSGADPAWSPDGTRIAFSRYGANRSSGIYVMDADGSNVRSLTANPEGVFDEGPSWSADGRLIVFSRNFLDLSGPDPVPAGTSRRDLYTVGVDGTGPTELVGGPTDDYEPMWSPDGSRIAFVRALPAEPGTTPTPDQIWTVRADGGGPRRVTTLTSGGGYPAWSPDGTQLAFESGLAIYVVGVDGSGLRRVPGVSGFDPAWSPDGTRIVFTVGADADHDLSVVALDGTGLRRLTLGPASDSSPAWGPSPIPVESPSPAPPWFEGLPRVASGEAAGTRWLLLDSGAGLWLLGEDATEFAVDTSAASPHLSFTSYTFRDREDAVTVAFGFANPEVAGVTLVGEGIEPIPAALAPIAGSDDLRTWWVAFDEAIPTARVVAVDAAGDALQSFVVHDPAGVREMHGHVVGVEDGTTIRLPRVELHRIEIFFNQEARREAVEDGVVSEGEDLPNPVYVRDLERTQRLWVSRDALVTLIAYDDHGSPTVEVPMRFAEFRSAFESGLAPPEWYGGPFRVTVEGGVVVRMEQVYVV